MMKQVSYSGAEFGFKWTDDRWDQEVGERAARKERDMDARRLRSDGWTVRCSSLASLITRGGIGTGHPEIQLWTKTYVLIATRGGRTA